MPATDPADPPATPPPAPSATDLRQWRANLQAEVDGTALYEILAQAEPRPPIAEVYRRLAETEARHANVWRDRLRQADVLGQEPAPSLRVRLIGWLARRFGIESVLPLIVKTEVGDSAGYRGQADPHAVGMAAEERSHARIFRVLASTAPSGVPGPALARLEGRHRTGGNALRAAVLGASDGLLSNFSLVMGVAGAELAGGTILLTGLAGLLAGATSMALGEWLSVQSSRELYTHQLNIERAELEAAPEEEAEELALIYQAKGVAPDEAQTLAQRLVSDGGTALDTLAREELGIDPDELGGSAWEAAATSFVLFAVGAIVPVLPFLVTVGITAVVWSALLSALALFGIGVGTSLFTGRHPLFSGLRQVLFGLAAAAITYVLGHLVGAGLAG